MHRLRWRNRQVNGRTYEVVKNLAYCLVTWNVGAAARRPDKGHKRNSTADHDSSDHVVPAEGAPEPVRPLAGLLPYDAPARGRSVVDRASVVVVTVVCHLQPPFPGSAACLPSQ